MTNSAELQLWEVFLAVHQITPDKDINKAEFSAGIGQLH